MTFARNSRAVPLALLALLAASCAVPLGPGFYVQKEVLQVRYVSGSPPHLEIRATFSLKNTGDRPLDSFDFAVPAEDDFGRANLRVELDGKLVSPKPISDFPSGSSAAGTNTTFRVSFAAPWPQKSQHALVISYDLAPSIASPSHLAIAENSFFLSTKDWYPLLHAPKGLFAGGDNRPDRFDLLIRVPDGFLVHAAGAFRGKKRRAAESEFRFRIAPDDFSPFVFAGRYHEQKFSDSNVTIFFWTLQPLPADQVARAGPRLAATAHILEKLFGPMQARKRSFPLWIAETPFSSLRESAGAGDVQSGHAPAAALLSSSAFAGGVGSEDFLNHVEHAWTATWPWYVSTPASGADDFLGDALREYAELVAGQARRGEPARVLFADGFLNSYDAACRANKEIPVALLAPKDFTLQRRIAESKLPLFLLAAENELGSETFHRALRRMVQSLRGGTYAFTDFRAALEAESGKDLGEFFRSWLNHPGIPADFRKKYEKQK